MRKRTAFTLIELLVSMALLSLLIVMLMAIVNNGVKLWKTSENRVDAYREARAALGVMSRDIKAAASSTNPAYFLVNSNAFTNLPVEAVQDISNAGALFFLSAQPHGGQWSTNSIANKSDLCEVGYYLAYGKSSVSSNAPVNTMNLYRYFKPSDGTFTDLAKTNATFADAVTDGVIGLQTELLARNIKSFTLKPYTINANGIPSAFASSANTPLPDLIEITIVALNQDTAKLLTSAAAWTNSNGTLSTVINQSAQSFTTRLSIPNKP